MKSIILVALSMVLFIGLLSVSTAYVIVYNEYRSNDLFNFLPDSANQAIQSIITNLITCFGCFFIVCITVFLVLSLLLKKNRVDALLSSITTFALLCIFILFLIQMQVNKQSIDLQIIYQENFIEEMKIFDDSLPSPAFLNYTQMQFKCCGYHGARDYKEFFKPATCCNESGMSSEQIWHCQNPPKDQEGNLGESPSYYSTGCAAAINQKLKNFHDNLQTIATVGVAFLIFYQIILLFHIWMGNVATTTQKQFDGSPLDNQNGVAYNRNLIDFEAECNNFNNNHDGYDEIFISERVATSNAD